MYKRPYLTALWLALGSIVGIAGQMMTTGVANTAFLALLVAPVALALARLRWTR